MSLKFHERFEIQIDLESAKMRFVNRVHSLIFYQLFINSSERYIEILTEVAYELGIEYRADIIDLRVVVKENFYDCLQAIEAFYRVADPMIRQEIDSVTTNILRDSEVNLGVRWEDGRFFKSGAKLLDEKLINESLRWLADPNYLSVLTPFTKGIDHFLRAEKKPELLSDVITDMYESLEALAKIVTGRDTKDLSANAQLFLKEVAASDQYKNILKEYISYANHFRHAATKKPILTIAEVESFIYLTGLFIRLATYKGK